MTDLIERLRAHPWAAHDGLRREAADRIEQLEAVVDAAKKVVRDFDVMKMPNSCPELRAAIAALEDRE